MVDSSTPRTGGRVTMQQVAAEAGVSVSTVSKVINGRYGVAPETFEHVTQVIEPARLRGQPGRAQPAQPPHQRDRRPGRRLRAVQHRGAQGRGGRHPRHRLRARRLLRGRSGRRARRLGAALPLAGDGHARRRRRAGDPDGHRRPVRRADRRGRPAHRPVEPADGGGRQPPGRPDGRRPPARARPPPDRHGHRPTRPASPPSCASRATARRIARGRLACRRGPAGARRLRPRARPARPRETLLSLPDRPTAIFAANDISALATLDVAAELGIDVPGQLSVVGFDNIPESALVAPAADHGAAADAPDGPRRHRDAGRADRAARRSPTPTSPWTRRSWSRRSTAAPGGDLVTELLARPVGARRRPGRRPGRADDPGREGRPSCPASGGVDPDVGEMAPMLRDEHGSAAAVGASVIADGLGQLTRPFGTAPVEPREGLRVLAERQRDVMAANRFGIPAQVHEEMPDRPGRLAGHDLSRRRCAGPRPSTPSWSSGWGRRSRGTMRTPRRPPGPGPGARRRPRPALGPGRGDDRRGPVPGRA